MLEHLENINTSTSTTLHMVRGYVDKGRCCLYVFHAAVIGRCNYT